MYVPCSWKTKAPSAMFRPPSNPILRRGSPLVVAGLALLCMLSCGEDRLPATVKCGEATLLVSARDGRGQPISIPFVLITSGEDWQVESRYLDQDSVRVLSVPAGRFKVRIQIPSAEAFFSGHGPTDRDHAEEISLTPGESRAVDFRFGEVRIRAIDPDTQQPVSEPGVWFGILCDNGGDPVQGGSYSPEAMIYPALLPGTYTVRTGSVPPRFCRSWFGSAFSFDLADTIQVRSGSMRAVDLTLVRGAMVSGALIAPDGLPWDTQWQSWIDVRPIGVGEPDKSGYQERSRHHGGQGNPSARVPGKESGFVASGLVPLPSTIKVIARTDTSERWALIELGWVDPGGAWSPEPVPVSLVSGDTLGGIDLHLAGAVVSFRDDQDHSVGGLVRVYRGSELVGQATSYGSSSSDSMPVFLAPGAYRFYADPIRDPRLLAEWWEDAETWEQAREIVLSAGEVTRLDFRLERGGSIAGSVRGPEDRVVTGLVGVDLFTAAGDSLRSTACGSTGDYAFVGLNEGVYRIRARAPEQSRFVNTWYPDTPQPSEAQSVSIVPPEREEGIDVRLQSR
jgi:hypothetical protein